MENKDFKYISILFLINPISGNQEGRHLLSINKEEYIFTNMKNYLIITSYFYNITDKTSYSTGITRLKLLTSSKDTETRVIIAGGDGTVLSIIEHLKREEIDLSNFIFGVIPFGTGNDLSNAMGFGSSINISPTIESIESICLLYAKAEKTYIDIWEIKIIFDEKEGMIIKNSKSGKSKEVVNVFSKSFINYFSLGQDARIGFDFDGKRSSSRVINKFIYFWEGIKKQICRNTVKVSGYMKSFQVIKENEEKEGCLIEKEIYIQEKSVNNEKIKIDNQSIFYFKGKPISIVCQNINFYMGGSSNIWRKSGLNLGLKLKKDNEEHVKKSIGAFDSQSYNDRKLEFFTYTSGLSLAMEKVFTGQANKLYHGEGPFMIIFKETPIYSKEDKENRIYLNIDGEFYHIVKPLSIRISNNRSILNGQIPFLINKK